METARYRFVEGKIKASMGHRRMWLVGLQELMFLYAAEPAAAAPFLAKPMA
jgi:hypothetical protein